MLSAHPHANSLFMYTLMHCFINRSKQIRENFRVVFFFGVRECSIKKVRLHTHAPMWGRTRACTFCP